MRYLLLASLVLSGFGCATVSEPEGAPVVRHIPAPQSAARYGYQGAPSPPITAPTASHPMNANRIPETAHPGGSL